MFSKEAVYGPLQHRSWPFCIGVRLLERRAEARGRASFVRGAPPNHRACVRGGLRFLAHASCRMRRGSAVAYCAVVSAILRVLFLAWLACNLKDLPSESAHSWTMAGTDWTRRAIHGTCVISSLTCPCCGASEE